MTKKRNWDLLGSADATGPVNLETAGSALESACGASAEVDAGLLRAVASTGSTLATRICDVLREDMVASWTRWFEEERPVRRCSEERLSKE